MLLPALLCRWEMAQKCAAVGWVTQPQATGLGSGVTCVQWRPLTVLLGLLETWCCFWWAAHLCTSGRCCLEIRPGNGRS